MNVSSSAVRAREIPTVIVIGNRLVNKQSQRRPVPQQSMLRTLSRSLTSEYTFVWLVNAHSIGKNMLRYAIVLRPTVSIYVPSLKPGTTQQTALSWSHVHRSAIVSSKKPVWRPTHPCRPCAPTTVASVCSIERRLVPEKCRCQSVNPD